MSKEAKTKKKIEELEKRIEALERRQVVYIQTPPVVMYSSQASRYWSCSICGLSNPPASHYHIT